MLQENNPKSLNKETLYLQCDWKVRQQLDPDYYVKIIRKLKGSPKTTRGILAEAKRVKEKILKSFENSSAEPPYNFCVIKVIEIL